MSRPTDAVRSSGAEGAGRESAGQQVPFIHYRRVSFADTDSARIVYTARVPEWGLAAIEQWFRERVDLDWWQVNVEQGFGTPFVHLEVDFKSPMTPRDTIGTRVLLVKLGNTSMTFALEGRAQDGRLCWTGRFACVFAEAAAARAIPIPDRYRPALEAELALAAALP